MKNKNNTITLGLFADAQKVANYLISNRMPFYFSATRAEAPGYNIIFTWDSDLESAQKFCTSHDITHQLTYLEM